MPINFIPNDPLAGAGSPPSRRKQPHANRPGSRASLQFFDAEPVGLAGPGTPQHRVVMRTASRHIKPLPVGGDGQLRVALRGEAEGGAANALKIGRAVQA